MSLIKKAKRNQAWLKAGFTAPSGAGKTRSALRAAKGFNNSEMKNVCVLDTEGGAANFYDDLGDFSVLQMEKPFGPDRYIKAIDYIIEQGFAFIIIDNISMEWDGPGGCLDIHAKLGGRFQDWSTVTPMHNNFIEKILQCPAHVLVTMRRKQDYGMVEKNGRMVVEKMGTKEIQRDGFEYNLTVNFDINMQHLAVASKDRTGLFSDPTPFLITEEIGVLLRNWCDGK